MMPNGYQDAMKDTCPANFRCQYWHHCISKRQVRQDFPAIRHSPRDCDERRPTQIPDFTPNRAAFRCGRLSSGKS
jgi:hypothetical protein